MSFGDAFNKSQHPCRELDWTHLENPILSKTIVQRFGLSRCEKPLSSPPAKDCMNLGIRKHGSKNDSRVLSFGLQPSLQGFRTVFFLVMLYERRRIEVKHYLRSSIIISEADFPLEGIGRNLLKGCFASRILPSASSLFRTSISVSSESGSGSGGTTLATGFPRSVSRRLCPWRTAFMYLPMRFLNSRLPPVFM